MLAGATFASAILPVPLRGPPPPWCTADRAPTTTALDAFRAAIGGAKNTGAPEMSGRREISWDGVRLDGTDVNPNTQVVDSGHTVIPVDRFRAQGALFEDLRDIKRGGFASVNPATAGQFPAFSPNNTFVMRMTLHTSSMTASSAKASPFPARRQQRDTRFRCHLCRCRKSWQQQHQILRS